MYTFIHQGKTLSLETKISPRKHRMHPQKEETRIGKGEQFSQTFGDFLPSLLGNLQA